MERIEFTSKSPSETIAIGERIGRAVRAGDLFAISGELGSGKTQLVKGIARGMGVADWEYVLSPSFTLMNIYEGRLTLCHVDLYRLQPGEAESLDIEEYRSTGVVAVEWAERDGWDDAIRVTVQVDGEEARKIVMEVIDAGRAEIWRNFSCGPRPDSECGEAGHLVPGKR